MDDCLITIAVLITVSIIGYFLSRSYHEKEKEKAQALREAMDERLKTMQR